MIVEFRRNGRIIIPKRIARRLGLEEGDRLDAYVEDGVVKMVPAKGGKDVATERKHGPLW